MKILSILLLFIFLLACKPEVIEPSDSNHRIVLNGLISSDSLLGVNISKSLSINDPSYFQANLSPETRTQVQAQVYIYDNNILTDSLQNYIHFHANNIELDENFVSKKLYPIPGHEYKIVVKSDSLPPVTAKTTIPNLVRIEKVDTSRIESSNTESGQGVKVDIVFTDLANEKNFYLLYVCEYYHSGYFDLFTDIMTNGVTFSDPIIEESLKCGNYTYAIAFSDKSINGKQHRLSLTLDSHAIGIIAYPYFPSDTKNVVHFRLYSITEDYYKYIHSLNLFYKNIYNPLSSPTQVYSNVTGGYGIFAGAAVSSDSIVFKY
jgi:hypothetical protein